MSETIVNGPGIASPEKSCYGGCREPEFVEKLPAIVYWPPISWPGMPTLEGHRLSAEFMADAIDARGFQAVAEDYELTKADLLMCLWWAGAYGRRRRQKEWGAWADEAWKHLWSSCVNIGLPPGVPS